MILHNQTTFYNTMCQLLREMHPNKRPVRREGETRLPCYKRESTKEEDEEHEEEERVGERKKMKSTNKKRKDKESERDKRLLFYGRFD